MDRQEQIRAKANIGTVAMRNTVKIHLEDLGYEFEETPWRGEEDLQNLTDYFVLRNGKPQWRGQHKHSKASTSGHAIVRYQRSSKKETDFHKLFKLPGSIVDNLMFSFTFGNLNVGSPYWTVSANSIKEWAKNLREPIENYIGDKIFDSDTIWSSFLYIPFNELSEVEVHKNYIESF